MGLLNSRLPFNRGDKKQCERPRILCGGEVGKSERRGNKVIQRRGVFIAALCSAQQQILLFIPAPPSFPSSSPLISPWTLFIECQKAVKRPNFHSEPRDGQKAVTSSDLCSIRSGSLCQDVLTAVLRGPPRRSDTDTPAAELDLTY